VQRAARLDPGKAGTLKGWGEFFFNYGERWNRTVSYNASYLKWREANPTAVFDELAQDLVLDVADTFSGNMTRVSSAAWQHGFLSIPTQFFSYQARIMEQMLPEFAGGASRITSKQKMQMFATYAGIYGVPTAVGTGVGVWPVYEEFREASLKAGFANRTGGGTIADTALFAFNEGALSTAARLAFGIEVNFAQRMGTGGLEVFSDWLDEEKSTWDTLTGVSGSVIADSVATVTPVMAWVVSQFTDNPETLPMLAQDFTALASNVSSVSAAARFYMAVTTRKYYTRNATLLNEEEQGVVEAAITAMTGLTLRDTADSFLRVKMSRIRKQAQADGMKEVGRLLRMSTQDNISDETRKGLLTRAGRISQLLELNTRQQKRVVRQNLDMKALSDQSVGTFSQLFSGGDPDKQRRILEDRGLR
jgi:hypothetical protein